MREAKKYFVLLMLLVVGNFSFFHAVAAPVLAQSNETATLTASSNVPSLTSTAEATEAAAIVPESGTWSSGEVKFGDKGGTFTVKFVVSESGEMDKVDILMPNLSACGITGTGEMMMSISPIDVLESSFSYTLTLPAPAAQDTRLKGKFISPTHAEGTFLWKRGDCEIINSDWTATPSPTVTPTLTATSEATEAAAIVPEPGHWEGTNPLVSFDVTADGQINNFTISVHFGGGGIDKCNLTVKEIETRNNGIFVTTLKVSTGFFGDRTNSIMGQFIDGATVTGSTDVEICETPSSISYFDADQGVKGNWTAKLKTPMQPTLEPTAAATAGKSEDTPLNALKAFLESYNNGQGEKALSLTCKEEKNNLNPAEVQTNQETAGITKVDFSATNFEISGQNGDTAEVKMSGNIKLTMNGQEQEVAAKETIYLMKNETGWKYCGAKE